MIVGDVCGEQNLFSLSFRFLPLLISKLRKSTNQSKIILGKPQHSIITVNSVLCLVLFAINKLLFHHIFQGSPCDLVAQGLHCHAHPHSPAEQQHLVHCSLSCCNKTTFDWIEISAL